MDPCGVQGLPGGQAGHVAGFEHAPFVEPTIFANVRNDSRLAQEEIFGPVLAVIPYKSITEAIQMANDTISGIASEAGMSMS